MNLSKLVAPLALGISLLVHSPNIKAEEPKYFSSFQFGGYLWSSPLLAQYVKDSPMLKSGFGTKLNPNLEAKFSVGYIFDKEKVSENGESATIEINAKYLEAMVNYIIPTGEGTNVYFGAGVSAISFEDIIRFSSGKELRESATSLCIPINIGTRVSLPANENIELEGSSGINLLALSGADFSGSFLNLGIRFKF